MDDRAILRSLLVAILIGCLAFAVLPLLAVFRAGNVVYLGWLCIAVAFEAQLSHQFYRRNLSGGAVVRTGVLELAALAIVRQLWGDLASGHPLVHAGLPRLGPETLWLFLPVALAWLTSADIAATLDALGTRPDRADTIAPAVRLRAYVLSGGAILFLVMLIWRTSNVATLRIFGVPLPVPELTLVVYLLGGVALVVQAQYIALHCQWRERGVPATSDLATRWIRSSFGLVVLAAALALLAPVAVAPLANPVRAVLTTVGSAVGPLHVNDNTDPSLPPPGPTSGGPAYPTTQWTFEIPTISLPVPSWLDVHFLFEAISLWLLVSLSLLYRFVWRRRETYMPGPLDILLGVLASFRRLAAALCGRHSETRFLRVAARCAIPSARSSDPRRVSRRQRDNLPLREQILAAYLDMLHHAARRGVPRHRSQTPHEFADALGANLRSAHDDLNNLTAAFVQARYSPGGITPERAKQALASERRLVPALRRMRKRA